MKEPNQWEVLVRVVRKVVDNGFFSELEGVGWEFGWQGASKVVKEEVVRDLQVGSTDTEGSGDPAVCWERYSVEVVGSIDGLTVAFVQCHKQRPSPI